MSVAMLAFPPVMIGFESGNIAGLTFLLFAACIVGYWVSKELVLNRTTIILEQIIERLRLRILYKIRETDLQPYEAMDKGRIYSALSGDAVNISLSAGMVINASSSLVMLAFTFVLMATISLNALFIIMFAPVFAWLWIRMDTSQPASPTL